MDYIELNNRHQAKMRGIISLDSETEFEWVDKNLDNAFLRIIPMIRNAIQNRELTTAFNSLIDQFNHNTIDKESFLQSIDELSNDVALPYNMTFQYYKTIISEQESMLISGIGGIGKSHYVSYIEKKLSQYQIPHLCIYGKFLDNNSTIPWEEIFEIASCEDFVLVIDAYNELDESLQESYVSKLIEFINKGFGRLFVTYRTNTLSESIIEKLNELIFTQREFLGVSYDETVSNLVLNYGLDVFEYEDILYSNNALWLKMLVKTAGTLPENKNLKTISTADYLIENYIKNTISKAVWLDTKACIKQMYDSNSTRFTEESIKGFVNNCDLFIGSMMQLGFIDCYDNKYYFTNETILNYLLARFFIQDLKDNPQNEIEVIQKFEKRSSIHEQLVLALFDYYHEDISNALALIGSTYLRDTLNKDLFRKLKVSDSQIEEFNKYIQTNLSITERFISFAGYDKRVYNCTNHLNDILFSNQENLIDISKHYANPLFDDTQQHLFNILMLLKHIKQDCSRLKEYFWYAIWISCIPNEGARKIATKILFEVALHFDGYIEMLINIFPKINDDYIKLSIVKSLSFQSVQHSDLLVPFFSSILNDPSEINSTILGYCYLYPPMEKSYIQYSKRNVAEEFIHTRSTKNLYFHLDRADMFQPYWIGFRLEWGSDENYGIKMNDKFIKAEKNLVKKWNEKVDAKFHCMLNGECSGSIGLIKNVSSEMPPDFDLEDSFDPKELFSMIQGVYNEIVQEYIFIEGKDENTDPRYFTNTYLSKVLMITSQRFLGSLMCNYYLNELINYPSKSNYVGLKAYNPLDYIDYDIISPISNFSKTTYDLKNRIHKVFDFKGKKDEKWANDIDTVRGHLLKIVNDPIMYHGVEWCPIAVVTKISERTQKDDLQNSDDCNIYATFNERYNLDDTGRNRYYTIEIDTAHTNLDDYADISANTRCYSVDCFVVDYDSKTQSILILPPPIIIKELELKFDYAKCEWINKQGETIIICDNNKSNIYRSDIQSITLIRKKELDYLKNKYHLKYFAFTERYIQNIGFNNVCDNHYQIENGVIVNEIKNTGKSGYEKKCESCPYGLNEEYDTNEDLFEGYLQALARYSGYDV